VIYCILHCFGKKINEEDFNNGNIRRISRKPLVTLLYLQVKTMHLLFYDTQDKQRMIYITRDVFVQEYTIYIVQGQKEKFRNFGAFALRYKE
jgi:hypothetical protein